MTVILAGVISRFPGQPDLVFAAVALAGAFQIVMGALGIGQYIRFGISNPLNALFIINVCKALQNAFDAAGLMCIMYCASLAVSVSK